jgi:hypothetical protein
MTLSELKATLNAMAVERFHDFANSTSPGSIDRGRDVATDHIVRAFMFDRDRELVYCRLLDIPTEAERQHEATLDSARHQRWTFYATVLGIVVVVVLALIK